MRSLKQDCVIKLHEVFFDRYECSVCSALDLGDRGYNQYNRGGEQFGRGDQGGRGVAQGYKSFNQRRGSGGFQREER